MSRCSKIVLTSFVAAAILAGVAPVQPLGSAVAQAAGAWTVQTSGTTQNLMGVKFIDANTGWAVGGTSAPAILKTANGGTNWNAQSAPGPQNLMGVDAWDVNNALISGYGGVVNRTANGGSNWSNVYYAGSGILRTIDYTDANIVYVGGTDNGNYSRYIKSTNSGANWSGISSPGADNYAMRFVDANTGWATHAAIQKTTNGGASWVNQLTFPGYLGMGMDVIDANTVYVVGQTGAGYGFVYKTTNGGTSWNNITPGGANAPVYRAVDFVNANTGWIVGNNGTIFMTVDGGANWTQQSSGTTNTLYGISAIDANTAWAVGINGTIVKYGGDISAPVYGSSSVSVSSQNWNPNGVNTYNITATVTETDSGFASAADGQHFAILTIINKDGENAGSSNTDPKDGGYFAWNPTGYDTGFTKNQMACTGAGGYAGMHAVVWGYDKSDLIGCSTTIIGGTLQKGTVAVSWTVRPTVAMLELADNDISLYSQDVAGNTLGWINNQINFVTDRTSPVGGTVSNPNLSNSLFSVSVNPGVDSLSGMSTANADYLLEAQSAVLSGGSCGIYGSFVDAGVNEAYNAAVYSFAGVSDNCYKFRYTVKDKAGNSATWVGLNATEVDLINPDTVISSVVDGDNVPIPNGGYTGSPDVTAIFFGIDNVGVVGYECSLDGSVYSSCVSPATYNSLALGFHTFNVQALDAAGNVDPTPASWNWTVTDVTPPDTSIDSAVDGVLAPIANGGSTGSDAATFAFSGTDNVAVTGFECSLDGAVFSACSSPVAYSALAVGAHSIQVRALDAAGNIDPTPAVWNWTVIDVVPPTVSILSVVDGNSVAIVQNGSTGSDSATFAFSGTDNVGVTSFECSLDGAAYSVCSSPMAYTGLNLGAHNFSVKALDAAGNVSVPAVWSWTILDVTPPATSIDSAVDGVLAPIANGGSTGSDAATFAFSGTDNMGVTSFECSLDGAAYSVCSSPSSYSSFAIGTHTFSVRALDAAGNIDLTPAVWNWTVAPLSQAFFQVTFLRHRVQTGTNPGSVKEPVVGARVNVYDETPGSCAATIGVRPQNYEAILNNCVSDASGITDSAGKSSVGVIAGDYVLIAKDCLADSSCAAPYSGVVAGKQGQIISAGQTINIPLQVIVRGNGTAVPAKTTVKTGSLLYIIEPEYIEWTNTQELYPFVFDAPDGAWDVTVAIVPPEGFVADYQNLSALVNNDYKVLQFTLTDIGSCWECGTDVDLTILHNGKILKEKHHIDTAMSANFAKFKKLDIDDLKKKGVRIEK